MHGAFFDFTAWTYGVTPATHCIPFFSRLKFGSKLATVYARCQHS